MRGRLLKTVWYIRKRKKSDFFSPGNDLLDGGWKNSEKNAFFTFTLYQKNGMGAEKGRKWGRELLKSTQEEGSDRERWNLEEVVKVCPTFHHFHHSHGIKSCKMNALLPPTDRPQTTMECTYEQNPKCYISLKRPIIRGRTIFHFVS